MSRRFASTGLIYSLCGLGIIELKAINL